MAGKAKTTIKLLGPLSVTCCDGTVATFPTQKSQALLGMIVLAGKTGLHRDIAADRLWSRSSQSQARSNLRQALATLRKSLAPDGDIVTTSGSHLVLRDDAVDTDLDALRSEAPDRLTEADRDTLLNASELLTGLSLNEAGFEDWLALERIRLREQLQSSLQRHAEGHLENSEFDQALQYTRKLLEIDEFHEASVRLHMRTLGGQGETATALRVYEDLKDRLMSELGVAPGEETATLADAIKTATGIGTQDHPTDAGRSVETSQTASEGDDPQNPAYEAQRPILAILPFANHSNDPEQDYLCVGLSEDITTRLSGSVLLSIAMLGGYRPAANDQTAFRKLRDEHGVHFVLSGSVRRIGSRVRVTAQLSDTETQRQIWADAYDGDLEGIFDLQDRVSRTVVGVLPGRVSGAVAMRATQKPSDRIKAYEYLMQAKLTRDGFDAVATLKARRLLEKVVDLDPTNARAWGYLQDTYVVDWMLGLSQPEDAAKIWDYAVKSQELDPDDFATQDALGYAYVALGKWDDAVAQFERTASRLTNQAEQFIWCGYGMCLAGHAPQALDMVRKGLDLDSLHPPSFHWVLGQVQFFNRDFLAARETLTAAASLNSIAYACRVVSHEELGEHDEAVSLLSNFCDVRKTEMESRGKPPQNETVEEMVGGYRMFLRRKGDWDLIAEGMKSAGLPVS
ncbi:MAG: BTAD domain-containing putative transcriptional regulator [Pseudomonadota bacterium]